MGKSKAPKITYRTVVRLSGTGYWARRFGVTGGKALTGSYRSVCARLAFGALATTRRGSRLFSQRIRSGSRTRKCAGARWRTSCRAWRRASSAGGLTRGLTRGRG